MTIMETLVSYGALSAERSGEPDRRLAVIACMDARMDIYRILDLDVGDAHVIRNAGGVVTDDVIRSLVISQLYLETCYIVLVHHTKCGMYKFDEAAMRLDLERSAGFRPEWSTDGFDDVEEDVRQSIARIEANPFVPHKADIFGFVFDVDTRGLKFIARSRNHHAQASH
ncbi:beta-class carbonic anhydrase [Actinokineospora sp.]|uniref:beta-class carbonic anhydrase n=1 Tax=Actinokineospora sp. TaxID=1872133 RepID=UPI003D6B4814